jgi:spermidine synthase
MSSLFTVAEIELARLALARLPGSDLDVVVGGLGLGFTAQAVLADERVRDLLVVDALEPVIRWHERGLVPLGPVLSGDDRCRFMHGDFFAMIDGAGFDRLPGDGAPLTPDTMQPEVPATG